MLLLNVQQVSDQETNPKSVFKLSLSLAGVSKGSVLSPILFNMFFHNILSHPKVTTALYAKILP